MPKERENMTKITPNEQLLAHIDRVIAGLNEAEQSRHTALGYCGFAPDKWHLKPRAKYRAIDCGTSGAFLVDAAGELYNISGYGRPDMNKKRKANLGNIATVDPDWLHSKRYNYLR